MEVVSVTVGGADGGDISREDERACASSSIVGTRAPSFGVPPGTFVDANARIRLRWEFRIDFTFLEPG